MEPRRSVTARGFSGDRPRRLLLHEIGGCIDAGITVHRNRL
jgi:hypothetical protein